jgi:mono/diheme cytochrome c family protein
MSSDSSDNKPAHNPIDVAVEGLVIRPDVFSTPSKGSDSDSKLAVARAHAAAARERPDFTVSTALRAIPLWALLPIVGVGIAAGSFVSGDNLALGPNVKGYNYQLTPPPGVDGSGAEVDEYDAAIWLAKGKSQYSTVCASCHQGTGEGIAGQYPPLKNSEYVIHGETRVVAILLHGIIGQLEVNGKGYNGAMPAQGAVKTNKDIAQIASYVRNEWGNKGSLVYDDQVAEVRKALAARTAPYTEAELKAIPQDANLTPSKHGTAPAAAVGTPPAAAPATPPTK